MESKSSGARLRAVGPAVGVVVIALVAVFAAMTILGSTQPGPTPSPSGSEVAVVTPSPTTTPTTTTPTATPTASPSDTPVPSSSGTPAPTGPPPKVITATATGKDPHGIWSVRVRYPQLEAPDLPMAATVNQDVAADIQSQIQAFEVGPAADQQEPGKVNTLNCSYTVALIRPDLASFILTWVDDTSGAHPSTTIETINYDLTQGTRLAFSDVFSDTTAATAILSQQSRDLLHAVLGADYDPVVVNSGTVPDCPSSSDATASCPVSTGSSFGTWALTKNGLEVIFQEYQVGAYADGHPAVVVPWSALAGVLKADGPGAHLAGA